MDGTPQKKTKILIWSHLSYYTRSTLWSPAKNQRWTNHDFVCVCNPSWQHIHAYLLMIFFSAFESVVFELRAACYTIHTVLGIIWCILYIHTHLSVMVAGRLFFCSSLHLFLYALFCCCANVGAHAHMHTNTRYLDRL